MVDQQAPAAGRRSRTRLVVQVVVSLVLVVAIFYFMVKKIDPAQVWAAITAMTWLELATLACSRSGTCAPTRSCGCR